jgi:hypothetical protein
MYTPDSFGIRKREEKPHEILDPTDAVARSPLQGCCCKVGVSMTNHNTCCAAHVHTRRKGSGYFDVQDVHVESRMVFYCYLSTVWDVRAGDSAFRPVSGAGEADTAHSVLACETTILKFRLDIICI